jgi:hypothetical protein
MNDLVYKTTTQPVTESAETPASWWQWTDQRIAAEAKAVSESVGLVLSEERRLHRREVEKAIAPLQREIIALRAQLDTLVLLSGAKPADLADGIANLKTPGPPGRQGLVGPRGARGARGEAAPTIVGWRIDPERYVAFSLMSDGRPGPLLQLRPLFEQFQKETSG